MARQAGAGRLMVRFRDLDVEVAYTRDGPDLDWGFDDFEPDPPLSFDEESDIWERVYDHSFEA